MPVRKAHHWRRVPVLAALALGLPTHSSASSARTSASGHTSLTSSGLPELGQRPSLSAKPKKAPSIGEDWSWWVGHQITRGHRKVPVFGKLSTHLETFYLAKIRKKGAGFEVIQHACASDYRPIAGVQIGFHAEHTPAIHYVFAPDANGTMRADSQVAWVKEDLDKDGHPGLSIDVNAKICRGQLYVGNQSKLHGQARWVNPWMLEGEIKVQHFMEILGSNSFCLRTFARSRKEKAQGKFRYRALSGPTTCDDLLKRPWLVHAESAPSSQPPRR